MRIAVPVVTIISLILALYFQVIYNLMVVAWSLLLVSLFAPYAAAYWWKKANRTGALAAFFGGFVGWIIAYFIHLPGTIEANTGILEEGVVYWDWAMWDSLYIASVWGFIASIVCLVVVSLLTQKSDPPMPLLDIDGKPVDRRYSLGFKFGKGGQA
jgi:SSS family solute:Na+ symporter